MFDQKKLEEKEKEQEKKSISNITILAFYYIKTRIKDKSGYNEIRETIGQLIKDNANKLVYKDRVLEIINSFEKNDPEIHKTMIEAYHAGIENQGVQAATDSKTLPSVSELLTDMSNLFQNEESAEKSIDEKKSLTEQIIYQKNNCKIKDLKKFQEKKDQLKIVDSDTYQKLFGNEESIKNNITKLNNVVSFWTKLKGGKQDFIIDNQKNYCPEYQLAHLKQQLCKEFSRQWKLTENKKAAL